MILLKDVTTTTTGEAKPHRGFGAVLAVAGDITGATVTLEANFDDIGFAPIDGISITSAGIYSEFNLPACQVRAVSTGTPAGSVSVSLRTQNDY